MNNVTRRGAVAGLALAACLAWQAVPAGANEPPVQVSLQLDWLYQGPNIGFIMAHELGLYAEEGLEVEISQGRGSGNTAQLVASKAVDFGFADGYTVANTISRGAEIRAVAGIYRANPAAVIVRADSAIMAPKDLEGRTIGIPTGSAQFQQWPAFTRGCEIDPGRVNVVNIDPAGAVPAVINGQVDAIAGFAQGYVPALEVRAEVPARIFWFRDCGVVTVSNTIVVHNDMLTERPEIIAPFVRASVRGFLHARANPQEAAETLKRYLETAVDAVTLREMELSWEIWVTEPTRGQPLGWMSAEEWDATLQVLMTYGGMEQALDPAQVFTNDFVPVGAEFVPPDL
jgi:NitT/TauT family transport system substrate-binding protein